MFRISAVLAAAMALLPLSSPSAGGPLDGVLRVCHWPDYFAISFQNPKTNALEGLDIDLSRAFARDLDARLIYVKTSFSKFIDDLEADRCDVAMFGVGVTEHRVQRIDYAEPYLRSDIYAVIDKAHPVISRWADLDRDGARIAVLKGSFMEAAAKTHFRFASLVPVERFQERETLVRSGRSDAFLTDYPYGQRVIRLADWAALIPPDAPIAPTEYAHAVKKGNAEWLDALNAFIARVKSDGRLKESAAAHGLLEIALITE